VEEWNEYGEIKEQLAPLPEADGYVAPVPSASNTPSKPASTAAPLESSPAAVAPAPASSASHPPRQTPSVTVTGPQGEIENPIALALRQAGFEAAQKAKESKSKLASFSHSASVSSQKEASGISDGSTPTGVPPPSGITESADAAAPDTGGADVASKSDGVPPTEATRAQDIDTEAPERTAVEDELAHGPGFEPAPSQSAADSPATTQKGPLPRPAPPEENTPTVEAAAIEEEAERAKPTSRAASAGAKDKKELHVSFKGENNAGARAKKDGMGAPADAKLAKEPAADEGQHLPGDKTREQPAASAEGLGHSAAE
jgi:hypothetical protein